MKPLLNERIAQFDSPFRRLDALLATITPNPERTPIIMSVGEPQDAPPHCWRTPSPRTRISGTGIRRRSARPSSALRRKAISIGAIRLRAADRSDNEISPVTSSREGLFLAAAVSTGPSHAAPLA
jgi:hypothetical protein